MTSNRKKKFRASVTANRPLSTCRLFTLKYEGNSNTFHDDLIHCRCNPPPTTSSRTFIHALTSTLGQQSPSAAITTTYARIVLLDVQRAKKGRTNVRPCLFGNSLYRTVGRFRRICATPVWQSVPDAPRPDRRQAAAFCCAHTLPRPESPGTRHHRHAPGLPSRSPVAPCLAPGP